MKRTPLMVGTAIAMAAAFSSAAVAQRSGFYTGPERHNGFYGDIGAGYILEPDLDTAGVVGRFGYEVAYPRRLSTVFDAIAYEVEGFYGVLADEVNTANGVVEAKVDYSVSGSVRAVKALNQRIDGFARVGVAYSSAEVESDSQFSAILFDENQSDTDLLLGLGGKYRIGASTGIRTDFTLQNDYELISIGISQNF